jgi:hypothetical protein
VTTLDEIAGGEAVTELQEVQIDEARAQAVAASSRAIRRADQARRRRRRSSSSRWRFLGSCAAFFAWAISCLPRGLRAKVTTRLNMDGIGGSKD